LIARTLRGGVTTRFVVFQKARLGVPVHIVAARLGDTPTTVLSTYAHLLPQSDEIAAERVAALLD
jgi:hypothetical protein